VLQKVSTVNVELEEQAWKAVAAP